MKATIIGKSIWSRDDWWLTLSHLTDTTYWPPCVTILVLNSLMSGIIRWAANRHFYQTNRHFDYFTNHW
jgi:hypothetical protein